MRIAGKPRYEQYRGHYNSGLVSGLASAHAATAGFFWVVNHTDSSSLVAVRKVLFASPFPAAQSTAIARVTVERATTSVNPTGTLGVPVAYDSADTLPGGVSIRTASTSMVLTAGALITSGLMGQALDATPAGSRAADTRGTAIFDDGGNLDNAMLLRAGDCIVVRQADNGDTDERCVIDVDFEVFQLAG